MHPEGKIQILVRGKCLGVNPLDTSTLATVKNGCDIGEFNPIATLEESECTDGSSTARCESASTIQLSPRIPTAAIDVDVDSLLKAARLMIAESQRTLPYLPLKLVLVKQYGAEAFEVAKEDVQQLLLAAGASDAIEGGVVTTENSGAATSKSNAWQCEVPAVTNRVDGDIDLLADSPMPTPSRSCEKENDTNESDELGQTCPMLDSSSITNPTNTAEGGAVYVPHHPPLPATPTMYRWEDDKEAMEDRWHVLLGVERIMDCPGLLEEWVVLVETLTARGFDMSASARASAEKDKQASDRSIAPFRLKLREQTSGRLVEQQCLDVLSSLSLAEPEDPALPEPSGFPALDSVGFHDYAAAAEAACEHIEEGITSPPRTTVFPSVTSNPVSLGTHDECGIPCDDSPIEMSTEDDLAKPLYSALETPVKSKDADAARRSLTNELARVSGQEDTQARTVSSSNSETSDAKCVVEKCSRARVAVLEELVLGKLEEMEEMDLKQTVEPPGDEVSKREGKKGRDGKTHNGNDDTARNSEISVSNVAPAIVGNPLNLFAVAGAAATNRKVRAAADEAEDAEIDALVKSLGISKVTATRMIKKRNELQHEPAKPNKCRNVNKKGHKKKYSEIRKIFSEPDMATSKATLDNWRSERLMENLGITKVTAKRMIQKRDAETLKLDKLKKRLFLKREERQKERNVRAGLGLDPVHARGLNPEVADPAGYLASVAETDLFVEKARESLARQVADELARIATLQTSQSVPSFRTQQSANTRGVVWWAQASNQLQASMPKRKNTWVKFAKALSLRIKKRFKKARQNRRKNQMITPPSSPEKSKHGTLTPRTPSKLIAAAFRPRWSPKKSSRRGFNILMSYDNDLVTTPERTSGTSLQRLVQGLSPTTLFHTSTSRSPKITRPKSNSFTLTKKKKKRRPLSTPHIAPRSFTNKEISETIKRHSGKRAEPLAVPNTRLVLLESPSLLEFNGLELVHSMATSPLCKGEKIIEVDGMFIAGEHELFERLYTVEYPVTVKVLKPDANICDV